MLITISVTIINMFHSFFLVLWQGISTFLFSFSLIFVLWSAWTANSIFFCWWSVGLVFLPGLGNLFIFQNPKNFIPHFQRRYLVFACTISLYVRFLISCTIPSGWITFPIQSCLVLYFFCASLQRFLIWLMVYPTLNYYYYYYLKTIELSGNCLSLISIVRPKLTCIMDSSNTILLESCILIPWY